MLLQSAPAVTVTESHIAVTCHTLVTDLSNFDTFDIVPRCITKTVNVTAALCASMDTNAVLEKGAQHIAMHALLHGASTKLSKLNPT